MQKLKPSSSSPRLGTEKATAKRPSAISTPPRPSWKKPAATKKKTASRKPASFSSFYEEWEIESHWSMVSARPSCLLLTNDRCLTPFGEVIYRHFRFRGLQHFSRIENRWNRVDPLAWKNTCWRRAIRWAHCSMNLHARPATVQ